MALLVAAKQAFSVAYMIGLLQLRRNPVDLVLEAASPFSLLFVLFIISGGQYIHFGVAGAMVMTLVGVGLAVGYDNANFRTEYKIQDIFVSSQVSSLAYMAGLALAQLLFFLPSMAVLSMLVLFLSSGFALLINIPLLIITILLVWGTMSSVAFFVSSHISHLKTSNQVVTALNIAIAMLPPVFYSVEVLPMELRYVAYAIPTTHASLMLQHIMGLSTPPEWSLGLAFTVQTACLVGLVLLAKTKAVWREKK